MAATGLRPYSTLEKAVSARVEAKKSVFLGRVVPVGTIAAADAVIAEIHKEHYSARHHCTALILGDTAGLQRSNDDGEPSGSAGAPMLSVLRHHHLTDVVAVVTRYFGGTLLGVGGLVRAYTDAVAQALAQAVIVTHIPAVSCELSCGYDVLGDFEQVLRGWLSAHNADLAEVGYDPGPSFKVLVAESDAAAFTALLAGWLPKGVTSSALTPARMPLRNP
jgi:uncharacterized YigZ family protein